MVGPRLAPVPESVADPARYYRNNLAGTLNLLDPRDGKTTAARRITPGQPRPR